jgi:hypothetical protein
MKLGDANQARGSAGEAGSWWWPGTQCAYTESSNDRAFMTDADTQ